jgi:lipopolysaccharide transport system ATP-binding protein
MLLRFAFAISTCIESGILRLDERLTVGAVEFGAKASQRLPELANLVAVLVVGSHNPALIDRVCNRARRLEHGRIPEDVRKDSANGGEEPAQAMEDTL